MNANKLLRLFCDACLDQNKNSHVDQILNYSLKHQSLNDVEKIGLSAPVRGHVVCWFIWSSVSRKRTRSYSNNYEKSVAKKIQCEWLVYDFENMGDILKKLDGMLDVETISFQKKARFSKILISIT